MPTAAIDFETYYDATTSIRELGVYHYLRAPLGDIYLVSIATDEGLRYVGHPKDFDWKQLSGPSWTWLSHNAQFDMPVFLRLQELGEGNVGSVREIGSWHDTADLAAFLGVPRSLKEASFHLLGEKVSKDTRDKMKGQIWETMTPEFRAEVGRYALKDAENCLNLWIQYGHLWPEEEREVSALTRKMALQGVPLDQPGLAADIDKLKLDLWEMEQNIPWKDTHPLLSLVALREECVKNSLVPPASFAQDDPESEKFFEDYSGTYPWIAHIRNYRKASKHLRTLETMQQRMRPDGWMTYGLKYGGAHTLRDSGESGINMQNLPKGIVSGVDVRSKIKAPDGFTFAIVDLSQIEPRCLHWLAEDNETLRYIRQIPDLYEAQARSWKIWDEEGEMKRVAPDVRFMMKQLALGLGYGMGAAKFSSVASIETEEAQRLTALYRSRNPHICRLWRKIETPLKQAANHPTDKDAEVRLPSGRSLRYRNVSISNGSLSAEIPRSGKLMRLGFWGGVLVENLVQSTARDVFMHQCLQIEKAGIPVIMRVHDEVVCLVREDEAEAKLEQIVALMSVAPDWAPGLPLSAEGSISKTYKK